MNPTYYETESRVCRSPKDIDYREHIRTNCGNMYIKHVYTEKFLTPKFKCCLNYKIKYEKYIGKKPTIVSKELISHVDVINELPNFKNIFDRKYYNNDEIYKYLEDYGKTEIEL